MLAERVKSESEAIEKLGSGFAAEYKLDGERVQIHYKDSTMILYSRRLENITSYYPDILENVPKGLG
jgi:DNA ligase-1